MTTRKEVIRAHMLVVSTIWHFNPYRSAGDILQYAAEFSYANTPLEFQELVSALGERRQRVQEVLAHGTFDTHSPPEGWPMVPIEELIEPLGLRLIKGGLIDVFQGMEGYDELIEDALMECNRVSA